MYEGCPSAPLCLTFFSFQCNLQTLRESLFVGSAPLRVRVPAGLFDQSLCVFVFLTAVILFFAFFPSPNSCACDFFDSRSFASVFLASIGTMT